MSKGKHARLVCGSFGIVLVMVFQIIAAFNFPFYDIVAYHFYDTYLIMKLSCIDTTISEISNYGISPFVLFVSFGLIAISYILIISSILKIASAKDQKKTFSNYTSHLTVVIVHYGCASIAYHKPKLEHSIGKDLSL